jgi:hypothetical protein
MTESQNTCTIEADGQTYIGLLDRPLVEFLNAQNVTPHVCYHSSLGP